jgi:hypothetical protein
MTLQAQTIIQLYVGRGCNFMWRRHCGGSPKTAKPLADLGLGNLNRDRIKDTLYNLPWINSFTINLGHRVVRFFTFASARLIE